MCHLRSVLDLKEGERYSFEIYAFGCALIASWRDAIESRLA
jgi:hypothetical protein